MQPSSHAEDISLSLGSGKERNLPDQTSGYTRLTSDALNHLTLTLTISSTIMHPPRYQTWHKTFHLDNLT